MTNDTSLPNELAVSLFDCTDPQSLPTHALRLYRDIYATGTI